MTRPAMAREWRGAASVAQGTRQTRRARARTRNGERTAPRRERAASRAGPRSDDAPGGSGAPAEPELEQLVEASVERRAGGEATAQEEAEWPTTRRPTRTQGGVSTAGAKRSGRRTGPPLAGAVRGVRQEAATAEPNGSRRARQYLWLAVCRWVRQDAVAHAWYQRKVARDAGKKAKAIVALMRKLAGALYHIGRGDPYDATKLFAIKDLVTVN